MFRDVIAHALTPLRYTSVEKFTKICSVIESKCGCSKREELKRNEAFQVRIYTCQFHDYKSPNKQESDLMLLYLVEL